MADGFCQRCQGRRPLSELRREWSGLRVCRDCWDPRHPQEAVRAKPDRQYVRNPAPEPADVFVEPTAQQASDL